MLVQTNSVGQGIGRASCASSQLKLRVSRLIRTVLWYSVKGFPCGFVSRWLCAHPDCSFVVRYDSVRPKQLTRGRRGWEKSKHAGMIAGNQSREEGKKKGKWVEEETDRQCWIGGSRKVNLPLFTAVSVKWCSFSKWRTSFEILLQRNKNTSTAEVQLLHLVIRCTWEEKHQGETSWNFTRWLLVF